VSDEDDIPTLTDLIESGGEDDEIRISDLGLDDADLGLDDGDLEIEAFPATPGDPFASNPALEQAARRILAKHMELAWQEIKILIQLELNKH